jgi:hypothetical protein
MVGREFEGSGAGRVQIDASKAKSRDKACRLQVHPSPLILAEQLLGSLGFGPKAKHIRVSEIKRT